MEVKKARTEFLFSKTNKEDDFSLLVIDDKYEGMLYNCRLVDNLIYVLFIYFPGNFEERMLFTGSLSEFANIAFVDLVISEIEAYKLMNRRYKKLV